ncbi:hypothetical protein V1478_010889 [Vespula squamosa]|uniref:Uncharacterized protein n=1 Tax=Vespula squamosa TaxID=30214 RepID=A0ABD2AFM6_VESSQ
MAHGVSSLPGTGYVIRLGLQFVSTIPIVESVNVPGFQVLVNAYSWQFMAVFSIMCATIATLATAMNKE